MAATPQPTRGLVYTFYSYKGGVGRSMALANVAALLARWGQKVLVLDWDLEAPGIERFFERWLRGPGRKDTRGLVDLVEAFAQGEPIPWADALLRAHLSPASQIHILSAGRDDGGYTARLQKIEWEPLFAEKKFGLYLEKLREEWVLAYDFILIDSRTGITDIGGICTIHLPDVVIPLFTANAQSLAGVKDVMLRARSAHADLPLDRDRLLVVPIPARDESNSEYETAKKWRERFALELAEFFRDWAPDGEKPYDILDRLKIPYFAYWSFGEQLPVMDEDPENPKTLAFSYQLIARLLLAKLAWNEAKQGTAATEAAAVQNVKAAELTLEAARRRTEAHREAAERETTALSERRERYLETRFKREVENLRNYLVFSQKSLEHLTQRVTYGGALASGIHPAFDLMDGLLAGLRAARFFRFHRVGSRRPISSANRSRSYLVPLSARDSHPGLCQVSLLHARARDFRRPARSGHRAHPRAKHRAIAGPSPFDSVSRPAGLLFRWRRLHPVGALR